MKRHSLKHTARRLLVAASLVGLNACTPTTGPDDGMDAASVIEGFWTFRAAWTDVVGGIGSLRTSVRGVRLELMVSGTEITGVWQGGTITMCGRVCASRSASNGRVVGRLTDGVLEMTLRGLTVSVRSESLQATLLSGLVLKGSATQDISNWSASRR